jgi:hypothetical protein
MKNKPEPADSSLSETMAARIEIKDLDDPVRQKEISDAVEALDGVIETKIENGALHVSYDPPATSEKKIDKLSVLPGPRSRLPPQIRKACILIYQRRQVWNKLPSKTRATARTPDCRANSR